MWCPDIDFCNIFLNKQGKAVQTFTQRFNLIIINCLRLKKNPSKWVIQYSVEDIDKETNIHVKANMHNHSPFKKQKQKLFKSVYKKLLKTFQLTEIKENSSFFRVSLE